MKSEKRMVGDYTVLCAVNVPIAACSLMFDGMENTVLDTNFQSALGIFVPVD